MRAPVAVLDACVLYPAPLRDLLMRLAVAGLIQPRWTAAIHEEWIEALRRERPELARSALERVRDLMNRHAEGSLVENHLHHVPHLTLPDPNDRHVLAAAIETGADRIVTWNLKDFPESELQRFGISAVSPDQLLLDLLAGQPEQVRWVVEETRLSLKNPEKSVIEYFAILRKQGLGLFCDALSAF